MKFLLPLVIAVLAAASFACQRQPASLTVPGYAEKQKKKDAEAVQPSGPATDAPSFFPNRSEE